MRRMLAIFILGLAIGVAVMSSPATWEYRIMDTKIDAADMVNGDAGWHVVPNQPNPLYLRRWRIPHP